jgi:hypothetical protein
VLIPIMCLLAGIVFYALHKDYTVRAGGKALGTAFFFEALKRPDAAEPNKRACTAGYRSPSSPEGQPRVTGGKVKAPDPG